MVTLDSRTLQPIIKIKIKMPKKPIYTIEVKAPHTTDPVEIERNRHNMRVFAKYMRIYLSHLSSCPNQGVSARNSCITCRINDLSMQAEMK